jgi:hypothetical protein
MGEKMLTNTRKKELALALARYRERIRMSSYHSKTALMGLPFMYSRDLFNTSNLAQTVRKHIDFKPFPCKAFGRHLVLKIVDELLDTGPLDQQIKDLESMIEVDPGHEGLINKAIKRLQGEAK